MKKDVHNGTGAGERTPTTDGDELALLLFGPDVLSINSIERMYPARKLGSESKVTRVGPSPTGPMHIGGLYTALISERVAHQSGGVFYVRLEDTDKKREMPGAKELIVQSLNAFGITYDEGEQLDHTEKGSYGPYTQSARARIYKAYVKQLVMEGKAYPCFATESELETMRSRQIAEKVKTGYHGTWALWRDKTKEEITQALKDRKPFVIRLRSKGSNDHQVEIDDIFKGLLRQPENDQDIVLLKNDGLPTYHLAHVIDDHLMGTTHVLRADEWLSSTALHLQMFEMFGWEAPSYGHLSPIAKKEGDSIRKLSKRKDPEASVVFYDQHGYPESAVMEYLMNLANPSFEPWRRGNPHSPLADFPFNLRELRNRSWALFDQTKLNNISRETLSQMSAEEIFQRFYSWLNRRNKDTVEGKIVLSDGSDISTWQRRLQVDNASYAMRIFAAGREGDMKRKDFVTLADIPEVIAFYFDDYFESVSLSDKLKALQKMDNATLKDVLGGYLTYFPQGRSKDTFMDEVRNLADRLGFAKDARTFETREAIFRGSFGDFVSVIRVALVGKNKSPDLFELINVMGEERVRKRIKLFLDELQHISSG